MLLVFQLFIREGISLGCSILDPKFNTQNTFKRITNFPDYSLRYILKNVLYVHTKMY